MKGTSITDVPNAKCLDFRYFYQPLLTRLYLLLRSDQGIMLAEWQECSPPPSMIDPMAVISRMLSYAVKEKA